MYADISSSPRYTLLVFRYRWIDWLRLPPDWDRDGPDYEERIIEVQLKMTIALWHHSFRIALSLMSQVRYDPMRKAQIALTGHGSHFRWIIATENMKPGDLVRCLRERFFNPCAS